MPFGRIYLKEKTFCRVQPDDKPEELLFLHYNDIIGAADNLMIGEPLEYELSEVPAAAVSLVTSGSPTHGAALPAPVRIDRPKAKAIRAKRLEPQYHTRVVRRAGTVTAFDKSKGFGFIDAGDGSPETFFHFSQIHSKDRFKRVDVDEEVEYETEITEEGRTQAVRVVQKNRGRPLERFAALPKFDEMLDKLKNLAQPERWNYQFASNRQTAPILYSYVHYTFERLEEEGKIEFGSKNSREYAGFNTGLVTINQEEIFGLFFVSKKYVAGGDEPKWVLQGFFKESDHQIIGIFRQAPQLASYFSDTADLLYDRRLELFIDIDHVVLRRDEAIQRPCNGPLCTQRNWPRNVSTGTTRRLFLSSIVAELSSCCRCASTNKVRPI